MELPFNTVEKTKYYCDIQKNTKCKKTICFIHDILRPLEDYIKRPICDRTCCCATTNPELALKDKETGEPIVFGTVDKDWQLYSDLETIDHDVDIDDLMKLLKLRDEITKALEDDIANILSISSKKLC